MNKPISIKAIIFDLDGTLMDTWHGFRAAMEAGLPGAAFDMTAIRDVFSVGAVPMFTLAAGQAAVAREQQASEAVRLNQLYLQEFLLHAELYPGVQPLLERLHGAGLGLGICTNRDRHSTLRLLEAFGLRDYFSSVVCIDDVPYAKPHPYPLMASLTNLDCSVGEALFVGDSSVDARCAAALNMRFVAHRHGYENHPLALEPSVFRFDDHPELLRWILRADAEHCTAI